MRMEQSHYIQRTPHLKDEGFRKWRLPTLPQRSAVPSAMLCVGGSAASLPRPCSLRAAMPRPSAHHAPVSAHTARSTPSELPTADTARLWSRLDYSRTPSIPPDCIKSMGSLSIRCSLWSRSLSIYRAFLIRCSLLSRLCLCAPHVQMMRKQLRWYNIFSRYANNVLIYGCVRMGAW